MDQDRQEAIGGITLAVIVALILIFGSGCYYVNSFKGYPGMKIDLPHRVQVNSYGEPFTVSVRIWYEDSFRPTCMLPDASNDISCSFYVRWMDDFSAMSMDGYRYLTAPTARRFCIDALWSAGPKYQSEPFVEACKEALMTKRWMDDKEIYDNPEVP